MLKNSCNMKEAVIRTCNLFWVGIDIIKLKG